MSNACEKSCKIRFKAINIERTAKCSQIHVMTCATAVKNALNNTLNISRHFSAFKMTVACYKASTKDEETRSFTRQCVHATSAQFTQLEDEKESDSINIWCIKSRHCVTHKWSLTSSLFLYRVRSIDSIVRNRGMCHCKLMSIVSEQNIKWDIRLT